MKNWFTNVGGIFMPVEDALSITSIMLLGVFLLIQYCFGPLSLVLLIAWVVSRPKSYFQTHSNAKIFAAVSIGMATLCVIVEIVAVFAYLVFQAIH